MVATVLGQVAVGQMTACCGSGNRPSGCTVSETVSEKSLLASLSLRAMNSSRPCLHPSHKARLS